MPALPARQRLLRLPEQRQLRHTLAVPAEQSGHAGAHAVPDMHLPLVDGHPSPRRQEEEGSLTIVSPLLDAASPVAAGVHPATGASDRAQPAAAATSICRAA